MSVLSSDTHPEIERMQIQLIRQMPAWKKMAIVDDLNETVRTLAISGIEPALDPYVTRAREDLAGRLGVPPGEVELVASALVTWPDAALGCPRPGMSYAQVATDGALIELRVTGKVYRYHSGGSTLPFLCQT